MKGVNRKRVKRYFVVEIPENSGDFVTDTVKPKIIGSFDDYYSAQECMSRNFSDTGRHTIVHDRVMGMFFDPQEAYSRAISSEVDKILRRNIGGSA